MSISPLLFRKRALLAMEPPRHPYLSVHQALGHPWPTIQIQIFISSTVQYNTETRGSRPAQHPPRTMTPPRADKAGLMHAGGGARRLTAPPTRVSPQPRKHLHTHAHVQKRRRLHYHRQRASPGWGSTTRRRGPRGDGNGASQARGRARQAVIRLRRTMTSSKAGRSARSAHPDTFYTD